MNAIVRALSRAARWIWAMALDVLPGPPPDESPSPDIDGRRPSEADTTKIDVDIERKAGRGGLR